MDNFHTIINERKEKYNLAPFCVALDIEINAATQILKTIEDITLCIKNHYAYTGYIHFPTNLPQIIDLKLCDIPETMEAYRDQIKLKDNEAVTLVPYFNVGSLYPFKSTKDFSFIVTQPSNIQSLFFKEKLKEIWSHCLSHEQKWSSDNIGFVVPGTDLEVLEHIRDLFPNKLLLIPGVGSQGAKLEEVIKIVGKENVLFVLGRSIINSNNPRNTLLNYIDSYNSI